MRLVHFSNLSPSRRYPGRTFSVAFELKGPAGLNTDCQSGSFASRYRSTVLLFVRPCLRRSESRLSTSARRRPCRGTARSRCTSVGAGNYQEYISTVRRHDIDGRDKPGHRCAPDQSGFGAGTAAGSAAACGARPTTTVRRPWPHNRFAAALASSSVTASTMPLRFSM